MLKQSEFKIIHQCYLIYILDDVFLFVQVPAFQTVFIFEAIKVVLHI